MNIGTCVVLYNLLEMAKAVSYRYTIFEKIISCCYKTRTLSTYNTREYYYNVSTLSINDEDVEISGTMGTSHITTIKVQIKPRRIEDYPESLKLKLNPKV